MSVKRWLVGVGVASVLAFAPQGARALVPAAADPAFTPIIIVDLVPSTTEEYAVATRVFSITTEDDDPTIVRLVEMVRSLNVADSLGSAERLLRFVRDHGEELSTQSSNRWVSHKGDSVQVIVLRTSGQTPAVDFEERARQSRVSADIDSLFDIAGSIAVQKGVRGKPGVSFTRRKYRLRNGRAVLKISGTIEPADGEAGKPDTDRPSTLSTTLVTGPSERVFLSANAAFTKVRQVKYNTAAETFEPGNKPTELLVGVNYSMQDMFQNNESSGAKAFLQGIYLGFLIEPSKRPFNQVAATIGFRHSPPPFESLFSLETVSPYVGFVWARNDYLDPDSPTRIRTKYGKPALIMGFALGLDKALGWLEGTK